MLDKDGRPVGWQGNTIAAKSSPMAWFTFSVFAFGVVATIVLTLVAIHWAGPAERVAVLVYGAALLAVLGFSAAYNLWPISPRKWPAPLRPPAIYLLIAGTYTPFMVQLKTSLLSMEFTRRHLVHGGGRDRAAVLPAASTGSPRALSADPDGAASSRITR